MSMAMAEALRGAIATAGWRDDPAADPGEGEAYLALLRRLHDVGRRDLPLGRLLEGHVDAVQIVARYGTGAQVARLRAAVAAGALLGVWNAAEPGVPLRLEGDRLTGPKSFASGAGVLTHALVTANVVGDTAGGPQLILLDLARQPPAIDRDWWDVTGMQRSETHRVRWDGAVVAGEDRIGAPGDYPREPWFSGGALRFVAVHAGGVAGLFDRTRDHLVAGGRAEDPFQAARLAELYDCAEGAAAAVARTAMRWFADDDPARIARVAATRLAVAAAAGRALVLAREAVGVAAAFRDHPLAALLTDLDVYLRQPVPDLMRRRAGAAAAAGLLVPTL